MGRDSAKKIDVHGLDVLTLTASTAPLGKKKRGIPDWHFLYDIVFRFGKSNQRGKSHDQRRVDAFRVYDGNDETKKKKRNARIYHVSMIGVYA